jgi:LEA14-like dessication related protein
MSRILKIVGIAVLSVGLLFGTGIALGVLGTPNIGSVENRFGTVNETNTLVHTDLRVHNPNPVGVSLGGTTVNYTVAMNDVDIAAGTKEGISIESGNSTLSFTTAMDNEQIPEWWYTHIRENETTAVEIDGTATSSTLGDQSRPLARNRPSTPISSASSTPTRHGRSMPTSRSSAIPCCTSTALAGRGTGPT